VSIDRFEDLRSWQEARTLVRLVYTLTKKQTFHKDFELSRQSRGATVSCMGNFAEAHGRFSFEEKRQFYEVAHGSLEELQSHLYVAIDQEYISKDEFQEGYDCAGIVGKLVQGSIDNLNRQISSRRRDRGRGRQSLP
jgi:four helix bundle protein